MFILIPASSISSLITKSFAVRSAALKGMIWEGKDISRQVWRQEGAHSWDGARTGLSAASGGSELSEIPLSWETCLVLQPPVGLCLSSVLEPGSLLHHCWYPISNSSITSKENKGLCLEESSREINVHQLAPCYSCSLQAHANLLADKPLGPHAPTCDVAACGLSPQGCKPVSAAGLFSRSKGSFLSSGRTWHVV